ncbi:GAF and ANTAR domain-containing protein [Microcella sp.]|uniref:GAF and ANTAR domain-containing protein n=1 Tax=Microcella sp. TaxID=1913979 RepID=UPI00391940AC
MAERHPSQGAHVRHPDRWGLCGPFMTQLPVSGALLSVVDRHGHRATVRTTDPVAARWDELELELGAGPLHDAMVDSRPQLVPDVAHSAMTPLLASPLARLGVRALFAFPLIMGSATVGVAGLYRNRPGALSAESLSRAIALARSATVPAVQEALRLAESEVDTDERETRPGLRREVHQATGMISAQLDVSTTEAFARLRAYAITTNRSISAVSLDVVARTIDFLDLD